MHEGKIVHGLYRGPAGPTVLFGYRGGMTGEHAIQWVRTHYCKKAVESREQISSDEAIRVSAKRGVHEGPSPSVDLPVDGEGQRSFDNFLKNAPKLKDAPKAKTPGRVILSMGATKATKAFEPMASDRSLWKAHKKAKV
jgi:hypothetical protein